MKKFWAGVLLAILLVNLTGCASVRSVFKKEAPTIWGKNYTYNTITIPSEAFLNSESRCRGLAPDGKRFLITDHTAPYLWDMETKEIIYLTPAGAEEEELMQLFGQNVVSGNPQDLSNLHGKDLTEAYFSTKAGFPMGPTATTAYACYDNNDMMVTDSNGVIWLLDADTGKLYGAREKTYLSAKGQKALSRIGFSSESKLVIENLEKVNRSLSQNRRCGIIRRWPACLVVVRPLVLRFCRMTVSVQFFVMSNWTWRTEKSASLL